MERKKISGKTVTIKVRYANFDTVTRSKTIETPTRDPEAMFQTALVLLTKTDAGKQKVRLLGISMSILTDDEPDGQKEPAM